MSDDGNQRSRVFVGNLPLESDQNELRERFQRHGQITDVKVLKGFGFVQFQEELEAQNAINAENGTQLRGKKIDVKTAVRKPPHKSGGSEADPSEQPVNKKPRQSDDEAGFGRGGGPSPRGRGGPRGGRGGPRGGPRGGGGGQQEDNFEDQFHNQQQQQYGDYDEGNNFQQGNDNYEGGGDYQADQGGWGQQSNSRGGGRGRGGWNNRDDSGGFRGGRGGGGGDDSGGFRGGRGRGRGRGRGDFHHGGFNEQQFDGDRGGRGGRGARGGRGGKGGYGGDAAPQNQAPATNTVWNPTNVVTNDCEIVCVNKAQRYYAESIETRLKTLGMEVDILFPNPDIPLAKIFGNITSRGVGFAILITPLNEEHRSLTLNVLQGQQQEHRNMPLDDALALIAKTFERQVEAKAKSGGLGDRHPEDVVNVMGIFSDNRPMSVMEYDKLIKYLCTRREQMLRLEYGENIPSNLAKPPVGPPVDPKTKAKQEEMQSKILSVLNKARDPNAAAAAASSFSMRSMAQPAPPPPAPPVAPIVAAAAAPTPALNDSLQKAIDSLIKTGPNLLNQVSKQPPPPPPQQQHQNMPPPSQQQQQPPFGGGGGQGGFVGPPMPNQQQQQGGFGGGQGGFGGPPPPPPPQQQQQQQQQQHGNYFGGGPPPQNQQGYFDGNNFQNQNQQQHHQQQQRGGYGQGQGQGGYGGGGGGGGYNRY